MGEYEKALADIDLIRSRMAASTTFRGFGPAALAATGILALVVAGVQAALPVEPIEWPAVFFAGWIVVAVLAVLLVGAEVIVRARRHHGGLADAMIHNAIQQFLPAGAAGLALTAILGRFAPDAVWTLPGLWQIFVSLGLFAAAPSLPRGALVAAAWYFLAGCAVLMLAADGPTLSPWMMGVPFAVGQMILAAVVFRGPGDAHGL
jgi:hypothetical protein